MDAKTFLQSDEWNTVLPATVTLCSAMEAYTHAKLQELRANMMEETLGPAGSWSAAMSRVLSWIDKQLEQP